MDKPKLWMSLFIIVIMVMSTAGFVINYATGGGKVKYNGYSFSAGKGVVSTSINGKELVLEYLPQQVEAINVSEDSINKLRSTKMVYMTSDHDSYSDYVASAEFSMSHAIAYHLGIYSAAGFTKETNTTAPVITCGNSTSQVPVLYFRKSNETRAFTDGNCVVAEAGSAQDFIALANRLVYGMLGVIRNG